MSATWVSGSQLDVHGKSLEYICAGPTPDKAATLVLLHEGLGSAQLWREFPSQLAQATGLGVFAYSRAGYGYSDLVTLPRPLDYMTREALDALPMLLDMAGITRCVLIGHSDGATIAAIYAGRVVDKRVRGIVLMAPHFYTEDIALQQIAVAKIAFETGDLHTKMKKYHRNPECAFRGWIDSWLHPDFKHWNVSDVIDQISAPVLAIQGRQDQYGTLAQIDEITRRCRAPVIKLVLDDCRHAPFFDQPDAVVSNIADFCQQLDLLESPHTQWPAYAYVPGQNERHPENAFDAIKASVTPALSIAELAQTAAFTTGLLYLDKGYYWEAHELLEPIWLALPAGCDEKLFVQGVIQTANACLKLRMQRVKAARRLCGIARALLSESSTDSMMGVERANIVSIVDHLERQINCA